MNVITVRRTVFRSVNKRSRRRPSFRELTRAYFARENGLEFLVEALFFVIIVAISAWPILAAAGALHEFFQRGGLIVEVDRLLLKTMEIAEGAS